MEISLRLVMVAMVGLIAAAIVLFMVTGETGRFTSLLDSQTSSAQCGLWETRSDTIGTDSSPDKWEEKYRENDCGGESSGDDQQDNGNQGDDGQEDPSQDPPSEEPVEGPSPA